VITPFVVPILNIEEISPAADQVARLGQPVEIRFTLPVNPYTITEDVDNDGLLDAAEDLNVNNRIDAGEDVNGNGTLDLAEDLNGDGVIDTNVRIYRDADGNGFLDEGEKENEDRVPGRLETNFTATAAVVVFTPTDNWQPASRYFVEVTSPPLDQKRPLDPFDPATLPGVRELGTAALTSDLLASFTTATVASNTTVSVDSVQPRYNVATRTNTLLIAGSGFSAASSVTIGDVAFAAGNGALHWIDAGKLELTLPPLDGRDLGMAAVKVANTDGTSSIRYGAMVYVSTVQVYEISRNTSGPGGGIRVTLTGAGFLPGLTQVFVNGVAAEDVRVENVNTLSFIVPAGEFGTVDISVTVGGSTAVLPRALTYTLPAVPPSGNLQLKAIARLELDGDLLLAMSKDEANATVLQTVDVSDPVDLIGLDSLPYTSGATFYYDAQTQFAYQGRANQVIRIDTAIPDAMQVVDSVTTAAGSTVRAIAAEGNLLVVGTDRALEFFTLTPFGGYLKSRELPIEGGVGVLALDGTFLLHGQRIGGEELLCIRDLETSDFAIRGSVVLASAATALQLGTNIAYLACKDAGVAQIVDFTARDLPVTLGYVNPRDDFADGAAPVLDLFVDRSTMFLACGAGGVQVFDITNPATPVFKQYGQVSGAATAVRATESFIFAGTSLGDILILPYSGLSVSGVVPAYGSAAALESSVSVRFSGILQAPIDSTLFSLRDAANNPVAGNLVHSIEGNSSMLTFRPDSLLQPNTDYAVLLAAGLVDVAGQVLSNDFSSRFRTVAVAGAIQPAITSISPAYGSIAGGEVVTIIGRNLRDDTQVFFGAMAATDVVVSDNGTRLTVTAPAGAGVMSIRVVNPGGLSENALYAFTYLAVPQVTSVTPARGSFVGGSNVTIRGSDFFPGTQVLFSGREARNVVVHDSALLTCETPDGVVGFADVEVRNPLRVVEGSTLSRGYLFTVPRTALTDTLRTPDFIVTSEGVPELILGTSGSQLVIYNAFSPLNPVKSGSFNFGSRTPKHVSHDGDLAYVALGDRLDLIDLVDFEFPSQFLSKAFSTNTDLRKTVVLDSLLIAWDAQQNQLIVLDRETPDHPVVAEHAVAPGETIRDILALEDSGRQFGVLIESDEHFSFAVLDVSTDPLVEVRRFQLPDGLRATTVYGRRLIATSATAISMVDLDGIEPMTQLLAGNYQSALIRTGVLFAAKADAVEVFDIAEPDAPELKTVV
ncbi:MAG TPA: IPT/TIG domain-containing protein, partial [Opitutus sp.]|nr:IPT/TIG domain-containing protein [Opitutus sp.]